MDRTVWDRIKSRLDETGKNQTWLAKQLGIERAAVANWKRRGIVPAAQYPALAALFGDSIDWVAGNTGPRPNHTQDLSAMALRLAVEFDKLGDTDTRLEVFARCVSAIARASEIDSLPP